MKLEHLYTIVVASYEHRLHTPRAKPLFEGDNSYYNKVETFAVVADTFNEAVEKANQYIKGKKEICIVSANPDNLKLLSL